MQYRTVNMGQIWNFCWMKRICNQLQGWSMVSSLSCFLFHLCGSLWRIRRFLRQLLGGLENLLSFGCLQGDIGYRFLLRNLLCSALEVEGFLHDIYQNYQYYIYFSIFRHFIKKYLLLSFPVCQITVGFGLHRLLLINVCNFIRSQQWIISIPGLIITENNKSLTQFIECIWIIIRIDFLCYLCKSLMNLFASGFFADSQKFVIIDWGGTSKIVFSGHIKGCSGYSC